VSSILDALRRGRARETTTRHPAGAPESDAVLRTLGYRAVRSAPPPARPRKTGIRYVILYVAFAMLAWGVLTSF
jgi:hypothetical protein